MKKVCVHCEEKPANRSRGLCWGCFRVPAIRDMYPAKCEAGSTWREPTMEELDRLIASRYATMPNR